MDRRQKLAQTWNVATEYRDALGHPRRVPAETLDRIVAAIARGHTDRPAGVLPEAIVLRRGRASRLELSTVGRAHWQIGPSGRPLAQGEVEKGSFVLPSELPVGTYTLRIKDSVSKHEEAAPVLVAPERAYQGNTAKRIWLLGVQLYAVRSRGNWGHGDFGDLERLIELASKAGAAGIGLNPIHALFDDTPEEASPYSPNSRLFINPLYIDLNEVPEFVSEARAEAETKLGELRRARFVDYASVAPLKLSALRRCYDRFRAGASAARRADLDAFREERGDALRKFASFETLRRKFGRPWWNWPAEWRKPDEPALARLRTSDAEEIGFHEYVQWLADRQLKRCCDRAQKLGMPIGLYLDVAVGMEPSGADAWSEQQAVPPDLSVGAPPDLYNTAGQNWGLTGFSPPGLIARQFEPFRQMLVAAMRYAGAIRLDHVLGLKRLYFIPAGVPADAGGYVRYPLEAMLAVVAQESVAHRCIVVGEDLGTVPEGFREILADWGIWSYRVMLFERSKEGAFLPPEDYAADALVTFSTHDLPSFAGWSSGHDLAVKLQLGLDPGETKEERGRAQTAFAAALRGKLGPATQPSFLEVVKYLAATPSRLLVVSLEDVLGEVEQPNVPGTILEHPNWRRRLRVDLEELEADERLARLARALAAAGRARG